MSKIIFFGYGYVASYLTPIMIKNNFDYIGTSRHLTQDKIIKLENLNQFDFSHILISIPPDNNGCLIYQLLKDQLKNFKSLQWIGLASTTGVYGNYNGEYVDESSELKATDQHSLNRILAEKQWQSTNIPLTIFRLSGIYGPGRSILERILDPNYVVINKKGHFFSRIYIDDIAAIIAKSILLNKTGIFNLADDLPCNITEMAKYAAKLLNRDIKIVDFETHQPTGMLRSFYMNNKKVSNFKVKTELNYQLICPSYKEGLKMIDKFIKAE